MACMVYDDSVVYMTFCSRYVMFCFHSLVLTESLMPSIPDIYFSTIYHTCHDTPANGGTVHLPLSGRWLWGVLGCCAAVMPGL